MYLLYFVAVQRRVFNVVGEEKRPVRVLFLRVKPTKNS